MIYLEGQNLQEIKLDWKENIEKQHTPDYFFRAFAVTLLISLYMQKIFEVPLSEQSFPSFLQRVIIFTCWQESYW